MVEDQAQAAAVKTDLDLAAVTGSDRAGDPLLEDGFDVVDKACQIGNTQIPRVRSIHRRQFPAQRFINGMLHAKHKAKGSAGLPVTFCILLAFCPQIAHHSR